ncbi:MAG: hypothetical protein M1358_16055, partial [Chloroflexi bacterium]|nr:hypothetical protein [Chloroflexota bacterium]
GGDLIVGISEKGRLPDKVCGIEGANPDEEKRRLEGILRSGIEPRIPGIHLHAVPLNNGKFAIVVRVPVSWTSPHAVKVGEDRKFYTRTSAGKHLMDVGELRDVFARSESVSKRIRDFRIERLARIAAGETPVPLCTVPKIVLHTVPMAVLVEEARFDVASLTNPNDLPRPLQGLVAPWNRRYNFDGFLFSSWCPELAANDCYLQAFRSGIVEVVDALVLDDVKDKQFSSRDFELRVVGALEASISAQERLGVQPPIVIMLSLLGVAGFRIRTLQGLFTGPFRGIDRDDLLVTETILDGYNCDAPEEMRTTFDVVWYACAYERSGNFVRDNPEGKWKWIVPRVVY